MNGSINNVKSAPFVLSQYMAENQRLCCCHCMFLFFKRSSPLEDEQMGFAVMLQIFERIRLTGPCFKCELSNKTTTDFLRSTERPALIITPRPQGKKHYAYSIKTWLWLHTTFKLTGDKTTIPQNRLLKHESSLVRFN